MNKKSTRVAICIVVSFMMLTGIIYFVAASQEVGEASTEVGPVETNENGPRNSEEHETASQNFKIMGLPLDAGLQAALFTVSGAAYVPVGMWILETKQKNKTPYIIAIVGSLSLILLYVVSRTISLPSVGLQGDVGSIDILSKIMQGGIIAGSVYILTTSKPQIKSNVSA